MDGPAGQDLVVKVPCGTQVWQLPSPPKEPEPETEGDDESPESGTLMTTSSRRPIIRHAGSERALEVDLDDETATAESDPAARELVADLTTHGQQYILCKGGRGGLGNRNFATARRQTPRFAQPGEPGTEGNFLFELRTMADVGLVGYPNAGKSTLLTAISQARPKVASYPFTTLHPQVGIVEFPDYGRLTVCDVPGLIEGAHRNVGLGHKFLRHIQRCKLVVVLLDMAGTDGRHPWDDYKQLLRELELYDPELPAKPRLVVANKMDETVAEANLKKFKRRFPKVKILTMAAAFDEGIDNFKKTVRKQVGPTEKS
jgi:GTP-binding protein